MPITRSFDRPFEMTDLTTDLLLIPNQWGLINDLGIFTDSSVTQHNITFEQVNGTLALITDKIRGERNNVNKDDTRLLRSYAIPHFPLDDHLGPEDVQGKRAYGSDAAETEAEVLARKMVRIRRNHAATLEFARAFAITTGGIYAPNGTVVGNYYTDFGITRKEVDFDLGTSTTRVIEKGEEMIAYIQDNIQNGEVVSEVVALCSPEFFGKLIKQAGVVDAYRYYTSTQEPNRDRVGTGLYRTFYHGGVKYIEYRGVYNGSRLIPAGDAYFLPMGTADVFFTHYSPANKFSHVNTLGEQAYMFTYRDPKDSKIDIETESNFINLIRRPSVITRAFSST